MFYYLSFLRPPPLQAPPHGTILITPQISNDLRTEPFEGSQDLYYSWFLEPTGVSRIQSREAPIATKPAKLTTWRPSSAYKEIPVPVPQNVRDGQRWRLVLTTYAQAYGMSNPESIDLRVSSVGEVPFPVRSSPVLFSARGAKGVGKQEMIERSYLLPLGDESEEQTEGKENFSVVRFTEKTSYDLDKKIWDSGIGLGSWLCDLKQNPQLSEGSATLQGLQTTLFSKKNCRILELGAGIGMVSVAMAILRRNMGPGDMDDSILTTDVTSAMPLLKQNISTNAKHYTSAKPQAFVLDWDDDELPDEVKDVGGLDAIVMADVSYNTAAFPALARTLSRLISLGSEPPVIVFGYKERDEAERTFWDLAAQIGIRFEKVGERAGAGGAPVEIWIGHV